MATRWRPNTTCECEVEYTIDDNLPADNAHGGLKVSSFVFTAKCPAHSSFTDSQLWDIIWDENPRYGLSLGDILTNGPSTLFDTEASGARILKSNIGYNTSWTGTAPNRVLNITISGVSLTNAQKNTIRNAINARFGAGKVNLI